MGFILVSDAFIFICMLSLVTASLDDSPVPMGHLQPLGSNVEPQSVTSTERFSDPSVFYHDFMLPGKPLHFKNVLSELRHPGLSEWTDTYLNNHYGEEEVLVSTPRKEVTQMALGEALSRYVTDELYVLPIMKGSMAELALVPPTLQCGGVQAQFQNPYMWLASGSISSVLHYDALNTVMCLLDGAKSWTLIDPVFKENVEQHGWSQEGYSLVDVDFVDMNEYPNFMNIPWHKVDLEKGDCLFVPKGWYHVVRSSSIRHLAVSLWFSQLYFFNASDCSHNVSRYKPLEPLTSFKLSTPNETYRSTLLDKLLHEGPITHPVFMNLKALQHISLDRRDQFFTAVDRHPDRALSWSELQGFDIDKAVLHFPEFFELPEPPVTSSHQDDLVLYSGADPSRPTSEDELFGSDADEDLLGATTSKGKDEL